MKSNSPWDNPYQGGDKKVLFVCSAGILRSATGSRIYAKKYNTRCAGSEEYALVPVTNDLLLWANKIVFVNEANHQSVAKKFDLDVYKKEIVVLDIPDQYEHMHPELIKAFEEQFEPV
jgi:predicted protein tyrosine phosphatase